MDDLLVLITGGTICREYNPRTGGIGHSQKLVTSFLQKMNMTTKLHYLTTQVADSRNFTREDRIDLWNICERETEDRILVIHGTDTICETARLFCEQDLKKTVVFTGAFWPMTNNFTDAQFNLGFGLACAKIKEKGVYVAMSGECLDGKYAIKNWDNLRFEYDELSRKIEMSIGNSDKLDGVESTGNSE